MENTTYSEYALRQMSIYDLRNFARDAGVSSPTIYKKEELIEKVMNIFKGKEKPHLRKTMQGRPPKAPNSKKIELNRPINNYKTFFGEQSKDDIELKDISILKDDSYKPENAKYTLNNPFKAKNIFTEESYKYEDTAEESCAVEEIEGYVFNLNDSSSFILPGSRCANAEKAVLIANEDIIKHNLQSGDYIKCVYKVLSIDKSKKFVDLINVSNFINGNIVVNNISEDSFNDINILNKNIKLLKGKNNIILTEDNSEYWYKSVKNIKNAYKVGVLLNANEEVTEIEKQYFDEVFYSLKEDTAKQNIVALKLAIDRAKRISELGKEVMLMVSDINNVISLKNVLDGNNLFDIKENTTKMCDDLLNLVKKENSSGLITMLSLFQVD